MTHQPTHQPEWISVEEAARRLGVSVSTIRRRIEAGELEAERELIGGSRERFKVKLETLQPIHYNAPNPGLPESGDAPDVRHDASAITKRSLEIIDAVIHANAETMERQAERIDRYGELLRQEMERRVRAEADRDHLAERLKAAETQLAAERAEAARRAERRFRWWPF
jgi:excisionase family DNA binding protein